MDFNEYQKLAARTMNHELGRSEQTQHSMYGMASEVGELHGIFQKWYQGHSIDYVAVEKELGDILWMISEFCTANSISLEDVASANIEKLRKRYPDGFDQDRSLHRDDD